MASRTGLFITLEGPEGSGKSSQARRLARWLQRQSYSVTLLRDPGSTRLGGQLRRVLLHTRLQISPLMEALLFIGGRAQLVEERILPALHRRRFVICDRFHDATVAYQGHAGGLAPDWLDVVGRRAIHGVMPEVTFLLDLPPEAGFARLRRGPDRMERKALAFHRRVRMGYHTIARQEPARMVMIDATQPSAQVQRLIREHLSRRFAVRLTR